MKLFATILFVMGALCARAQVNADDIRSAFAKVDLTWNDLQSIKLQAPGLTPTKPYDRDFDAAKGYKFELGARVITITMPAGQYRAGVTLVPFAEIQTIWLNASAKHLVLTLR